MIYFPIQSERSSERVNNYIQPRKGCLESDPHCQSHSIQNSVLEEFLFTFRQSVLPIICQILYKNNWRYLDNLFSPIWYTLKNRRNFFRSGLLNIVGQLCNCPSILPPLAACVEIAWTCALILDDVIDSSKEREGQLCAYIIYGPIHCILAVTTALALVFLRILFKVPGNIKMRIARTKLSLILFIRCMLSQLRSSRYRSLEDYHKYSREVNLSIHWSLLSPFCGNVKTALVQILKSFADHSAIAGKFRNDILDYLGGSSERDSILEDFRSRKITLPILLLLNTPLRAGDREILQKYFFGNSTLSINDILEMLNRYKILNQSLFLLKNELNESKNFINRMHLAGVPKIVIGYLERWNAYMVDSIQLRR